MVSVPAIRKAMGIAPDTASVGTATDPPPARAARRPRSLSPPPPSLPATVEVSHAATVYGNYASVVGIKMDVP